MISYRWNHDKNLKLKQDRGVSFEQAVMHIERGDLLDEIRHPNSLKYPHQKVLVVRMRGYVYAIPYVEKAEERFLKTIIPSRKPTRQYIGENDEA
ncbi:MAG: toxin [Lentisphaeria bacterium]|nr:toxin [Lentisphaeria bacterium]